MKHNKRGVSPIIATILLIAIVVVLTLIIFLWARGFVAERGEKFGRAVELSCTDVVFESGIFLTGQDAQGQDEYTLDIINRGNVPIYGLIVKSIDRGRVEITKEIFGNTISIGEAETIPLENEVSAGEKILIVPIILGESGSSKASYTCEDETGYLLTV